MELAVSEFSQMEIGISDRNPNMCDGAKDKGKTAIVDCKIPPTIDSDSDNDNDSYSDDSDSDNDSEVVLKRHLDCKDGVRIDAAPFKSESKLVQMRYKAYAGGNKVLETDSKTLEMVKVFCEGRAKILIEKEKFDIDKLNEFNSKFLQDYRSNAFQLIIAGFDLDIVSLIDLMMEEVVNLLTTKWTEDEVYNFFTVNFKEYHRPDDKFNVMKKDLLNYREFLDFNFNDYCNSIFPNRDVRANYHWDYDILKQKFHSLRSYEQRRHWLTAHFLLRRPRHDRVFFMDDVLRMRERREKRVVI